MVTPIGWPSESTVRSGRSTPRPVARRPRSVRRGPSVFSCVSASRPQNASFFQPTAHPARACTGLMSRESSCPCSG
ncbi:Uncharacterised protein [Mycobacteroides abscessus subsp. abscessus]|nr:Uncharacterised protein [Mycobacteroides abscessus subsp. abscessus]